MVSDLLKYSVLPQLKVALLKRILTLNKELYQSRTNKLFWKLYDEWYPAQNPIHKIYTIFVDSLRYEAEAKTRGNLRLAKSYQERERPRIESLVLGAGNDLFLLTAEHMLIDYYNNLPFHSNVLTAEGNRDVLLIVTLDGALNVIRFKGMTRILTEKEYRYPIIALSLGAPYSALLDSKGQLLIIETRTGDVFHTILPEVPVIKFSININIDTVGVFVIGNDNSFTQYNLISRYDSDQMNEKIIRHDLKIVDMFGAIVKSIDGEFYERVLIRNSDQQDPIKLQPPLSPGTEFKFVYRVYSSIIWVTEGGNIWVKTRFGSSYHLLDIPLGVTPNVLVQGNSYCYIYY